MHQAEARPNIPRKWKMVTASCAMFDGNSIMCDVMAHSMAWFWYLKPLSTLHMWQNYGAREFLKGLDKRLWSASSIFAWIDMA